MDCISASVGIPSIPGRVTETAASAEATCADSISCFPRLEFHGGIIPESENPVKKNWHGDYFHASRLIVLPGLLRGMNDDFPVRFFADTFCVNRGIILKFYVGKSAFIGWHGFKRLLAVCVHYLFGNPAG